jgi:hypothetical protein
MREVFRDAVLVLRKVLLDDENMLFDVLARTLHLGLSQAVSLCSRHDLMYHDEWFAAAAMLSEVASYSQIPVREFPPSLPISLSVNSHR